MPFLSTLMSLSDTLSLSARPHHIPLGAEVLLTQQHFPDVLLCAQLQQYKQDRFLSPQAYGLAVENAAARKCVHGQLSCCSGRVGCGETDAAKQVKVPSQKGCAGNSTPCMHSSGCSDEEHRYCVSDLPVL